MSWIPEVARWVIVKGIIWADPPIPIYRVEALYLDHGLLRARYFGATEPTILKIKDCRLATDLEIAEAVAQRIQPKTDLDTKAANYGIFRNIGESDESLRMKLLSIGMIPID